VLWKFKNRRKLPRILELSEIFISMLDTILTTKPKLRTAIFKTRLIVNILYFKPFGGCRDGGLHRGPGESFQDGQGCLRLRDHGNARYPLPDERYPGAQHH
jgi:hypothetical protein